MKPNLRFRALAASLTLIQYASATDYQFTPTTAPFSTGFSPGLTSGSTTTSDRLLFSGTDVSYIATDDITGITVNAEVFNPTSTALQTITVARGGGDNLVNLGGPLPYLNFANAGSAAVVENLDHTFLANGYITKSFGQGQAGANPVMNGALNLGTNTVTLAIADSVGDGQAELTINGMLSGSGTLILDNADATAGVGAPGTGTPDWGTVLLSANNAGFTGPVTLNKGRLVVNNNNAAGTGLITIGGSTNSGGVLSLGGNNGGNVVQNYGGIPAATTGITLQNAINAGGETSGNYGQGIINNSGANTISGVVTLQQTPVNVQVNHFSSLTFSNTVAESSASQGITKSGNGLLRINNASYTGTTTITAGTVAFTGSAPAGLVTMTVGAGLAVGDAGNIFPTVASALSSGKISATTAGSIALTGDVTEAIDLTGFNGLGIGATPAGANFSGTLTVPGSYRLGGGGGVLTISGTNTFTGSKSVNVTGGAVVINAANNYTGTTALTNNSLTLGAAGAIGPSGTISFTGGTLRFTAANTTDYSNRFSTQANQQYNIDTNGQNITFANNLIGTGTSQFLKAGAGTLTLGNGTPRNYGTANVFVENGTLSLATGATLTNTGTTNVGRVAGQTGTLELLGTAALTTNGDFNVGDLTNTSGVLRVSGTGAVRGGTTYIGKNGTATGLLSITGGGSYTQVGGGDTRIGGGVSGNDLNAVGILNLVNGTFTTPTNFQIGANGRGGYFQSGGTTVITGGFPSIGRYPGGFGVFDVSGGNVNYILSGTGNRFIVGEQGAGILNIRGGSFTNGSNNITSALTVGNIDDAGSVGFVNLTGGTLNTLSVGKLGNAATGIFNFNGGTLKARANNSTFMSGLTSAYVYPGNAIIDSNGFNITINQSLLAPAGSGVSAISFTGGTGFTAAPIVRLTGGNGVGAAAIATVDEAGNLTGIVVTNPGVGYTVAPTVTLYNASLTPGGVLPTGLAANLAPNSSGGLVKNGTGILTLSGVNTYTGTTTVNAGVLALGIGTLADNSSLIIGPAGMLNLENGEPDKIAFLTIDGIPKEPGIYDASTDPSFITGFGSVEVTGVVSAGYDTYKADPGNGLSAGVDDGIKDDPDKDGIPNLLEFILGGVANGPGSSNTSILPTRSLTATDLIVSFKRADASEGDVSLKVQWSSDLTNWGSPKEITIGAGDTGSVTVLENGAAPDTVTVTIPRAGNEVGGKLFARVTASRP